MLFSFIYVFHRILSWIGCHIEGGSMDITAVLAIAGINVALFTWMRSDFKAFEGEIRGWKEEINKEMKDFHGRMCALEERKKNER